MEELSATSPVIISLARNDRERGQALALNRAVALRLYNCSPPPPSQCIFTAKQNGEVVGMIALDFDENDAPFRLEKIYDFDRHATPFPFERRNIAEFGRWICVIRGISSALMYVATMYAIRRDKLYSLGEFKERIARRAEELGWQVHFVEGACLLFENVSEEERGYYADPPSPRLVMSDLREREEALRNRTMDAIFKGKIILDFSS